MERQKILKQEVRRERHIEAHFRYRDDIFLIARGGNDNLGTPAKHWKHVAISHKSPCLIEGWVVSSEPVVYLNSRKTVIFRCPAVPAEFSSEVGT